MANDKTGLAKLIPGAVSVEIQETLKARITVKLTHEVDLAKLRRGVSTMLQSMGLDGGEPNFKDTPRRVTNLWNEWLKPQSLELPVFPDAGGGMVTLIDHQAVTVCPHHLLPVTIRADVAYIPSGHCVGISKLARVVNLAAASFMLQEDISKFVVGLLDSLLLPKGVWCRVVGEHGCMKLRGVKSTGRLATTNMTGVFLTDEKARSEVFQSL